MQIVAIESLIADLARCMQLRNDGLLFEALACIDALLARAPMFAPAFIERATVLAALGRYADGLAECERYLSFAPPSAAMTAFRDGMRDEALAHYDGQLRRDPDAVDALFQRANVDLVCGNWSAAEHTYLCLLAAAPDHFDALNNLGMALANQDRDPEALAVCDRALALMPLDAAGHFNRANVLCKLHRREEAMSAYREAIAHKADFAEAYRELAHCGLAIGRFEESWRHNEWRWQAVPQKWHYLASAAPSWPASETLAGKTILLWAEQGLGDTLQFARFVRLVTGRARKIVLRAPASLTALLQTLDTRIEVIDEQADLPPHDCHCPLMSLPLALGLNAVADMASAPYLHADAALAAQWQTFLAPVVRPKRLRVGLTWAGKQIGGVNASRDMPLAALLPLASADADFICLQKELSEHDVALLDGVPGWLRPQSLLTDMAATAALITELDLVIAVDTAVAHLAGALGTPCWLLLRHSGEWRWQLQADATPWYGSVRLFRQRTPGQWQEVVDAVGAQLRQLAAA